MYDWLVPGTLGQRFSSLAPLTRGRSKPRRPGRLSIRRGWSLWRYAARVGGAHGASGAKGWSKTRTIQGSESNARNAAQQDGQAVASQSLEFAASIPYVGYGSSSASGPQHIYSTISKKWVS